MGLRFVEDDEIRFFRPTGRFVDMGRPNHKHHTFHEAVRAAQGTSAGQLIPHAIFENIEDFNGGLLEIDRVIRNVSDDAVFWSAKTLGSGISVRAARLYARELTLALMYYAPSAKRGALFSNLASWSPEDALRILENGIAIWGMDPIGMRKSTTLPGPRTTSSPRPTRRHGS